jgi:Glycosyl transferase family 2
MASATANSTVVGICSYVGGERHLLLEWLEYHRLLGVQHFYLYVDRNDKETRALLQRSYGASVGGLMSEVPLYSTTNTRTRRATHRRALSKLNRRAEEGGRTPLAPEDEAAGRVATTTLPMLLIEVRDQPPHEPDGDNPQAVSLSSCVRHFGRRNDWLLFFDVDEFVTMPLSQAGRSLGSVLDEYGSVGGVLLPEKRFTAAGGYERSDRPTRPPGQLLTEALRYWRPVDDLSIVKMALHTGHAAAVGRHCHFLNKAGGREFAHNCLHSAPEELLPVLASTRKPTKKKYRVDHRNLSYTGLALNHYFTRSCYEWKHELVPKRAGHIWYRAKNSDARTLLQRVGRGEMNMTTALLSKLKLLPSFLARVDPELCMRFANSTELVRDHRLDPYLAALHARVAQLRF